MEMRKDYSILDARGRLERPGNLGEGRNNIESQGLLRRASEVSDSIWSIHTQLAVMGVGGPRPRHLSVPVLQFLQWTPDTAMDAATIQQSYPDKAAVFRPLWSQRDWIVD